MKAVSVVTIRKELKHKTSEELAELCLRLSRFKKENKELLTYLLFEADSEAGYIETVKAEIDEQFEIINTDSFFYIKKSVRKILRNTKKYIRYSLNKETEVELLLYFCKKLKKYRLFPRFLSVLSRFGCFSVRGIQKHHIKIVRFFWA